MKKILSFKNVGLGSDGNPFQSFNIHATKWVCSRANQQISSQQNILCLSCFSHVICFFFQDKKHWSHIFLHSHEKQKKWHVQKSFLFVALSFVFFFLNIPTLLLFSKYWLNSLRKKKHLLFVRQKKGECWNHFALPQKKRDC